MILRPPRSPCFLNRSHSHAKGLTATYLINGYGSKIWDFTRNRNTISLTGVKMSPRGVSIDSNTQYGYINNPDEKILNFRAGAIVAWYQSYLPFSDESNTQTLIGNMAQGGILIQKNTSGRYVFNLTDGVSDFTGLSQTSRNWAGMTTDNNNNVYACVYSGDIYKQTNATGNFVALSQTSRDWHDMTTDNNNNVYACVRNGDIYKQTNATGDFVALSQTTRDWTGMTTDNNNNVYACAYGGDIYKQTNATGDFVALSQTSRDWYAMTTDNNNNVYACVRNGDIYKQTNATGDFVALSQTSRYWFSMTTDSNNNVYACEYGGDIYKQTNATGDFVALSQTSRGWIGMTTDNNNNVYACVYGGDIYKQTGGVTDHSVSYTSDKFPNWENGQTIAHVWDIDNPVYGSDHMAVFVNGVPVDYTTESNSDNWESTLDFTQNIGVFNRYDNGYLNNMNGFCKTLSFYSKSISVSKNKFIYRDPYAMYCRSTIFPLMVKVLTEITGTINGVLPEVTGSSIGLLQLISNVTGILPELEGSNTGLIQLTATISSTLPELVGSNSLQIPVQGLLTGLLPELSASLSGESGEFADFGFQERANVYSSHVDIVYPQVLFPIINLNENDVATGTIKFKRDLIDNITSITLKVYEAYITGTYWQRLTTNLYSAEVANANSYLSCGRKFIRWRFDPTSLPVTHADSLYYVLFLEINKTDDALIGQAYIEIIFKILNNSI